MTAFSQITLLPPRGSVAWRWAVGFLAAAPFLYGCLALYLGQDANWDLRNYHWYNAYAFLTGRYGMDLLPAQTPSFYNPTMDVPFYLLGTHLSAHAAYFILAMVQGLNFVLLFFMAHACLLIGNPLRKVWTCGILAAIGVLGAGGIAQVGATFYDNVTSLGLFASALIVILRLDLFKKAAWPVLCLWAFLGGLPSGLMLGLKLPSIVFCVGLCGSLLFLSLSWPRRLGVAFCFGCGILAGVALSLGHWAVYLQTQYQNPLFPYFNQFFQSPLAPIASSRDTQFIPLNWEDRLFFPYIFAVHPMRVGEILWRDWRIASLYTLMPIAAVSHLIYGRSSKNWSPVVWGEASRFLLCFAALSYFVWLFLFAIYRYVVPLEMLAPLLIVICFGLLPLRRKTRVLWASLLLVALVLTMQPGSWGRKDQWMDRVVEIDRPELGNTENLMILMAGREPYSHVIPEFPPEIAFVRIQSNFTDLGPSRGMDSLIQDKIKAHKAEDGHFMMLIPPWQHKMAQDFLTPLGLKLIGLGCQEVDDKLYDKLDLCEVVTWTKKSILLKKRVKSK